MTENDMDNKLDPKYFNWLICSIGASFLLFGCFIFMNGGDANLFNKIFIVWAFKSAFGGAILAVMMAVIAIFLKKNWKNACLFTVSIMIFLNALATIYTIT